MKNIILIVLLVIIIIYNLKKIENYDNTVNTNFKEKIILVRVRRIDDDKDRYKSPDFNNSILSGENEFFAFPLKYFPNLVSMNNKRLNYFPNGIFINKNKLTGHNDLFIANQIRYDNKYKIYDLNDNITDNYDIYIETIN